MKKINIKFPDFEDKDLFLICITVICALSIFLLKDDLAAGIVEKAFYGMGGIVTGRALSGNK